MQQQFEPLSRSVRDLGDGVATFDRTVLAYLRADTPRQARGRPSRRRNACRTRRARCRKSTRPRNAPPVRPAVAAHRRPPGPGLPTDEHAGRAPARHRRTRVRFCRAGSSHQERGRVRHRRRRQPHGAARRLRSWRAPWKPPDTTSSSELTRGGNFSAGPNGGETRLRQTTREPPRGVRGLARDETGSPCRRRTSTGPSSCGGRLSGSAQKSRPAGDLRGGRRRTRGQHP